MNEVNNNVQTPETPNTNEPKKPSFVDTAVTKVKEFVGPVMQKSSPKQLQNFAILLISFVLLILSFCPIITYSVSRAETEWDDGEVEVVDVYKSKIRVNAPTAIGLFFDTLQSKSQKKLMKTDLYDDMEDLYEEIQDEYDDLDDDESCSDKILKLEQKLTWKMYKLMLRSDSVSINLFSILSFITSIMLILGCIALFGLSLWRILPEFVPSVPECKFVKFIPLLLCVVPMLFFFLFYTLDVGTSVNNMAMFEGTYYAPTMSASAVIAIILSMIGIVGIVVMRVLDKEIEVKGEVLTRIIAAGIAFVMICMVGSTIFSVRIDGDCTADGKTVRVSNKIDVIGISLGFKDAADFYTDGGSGSMVGSYYENALDNLGENSNATKYSLKTLVPLSVAASFGGLSEADEDTAGAGTALLTLLVMSILVVVAFSAVIFVLNVMTLLTDKKPKLEFLGFKIAKVPLLLLLTGFFLIFVIAFNDVVDTDLVSMSIGLPMVISCILSILSLIFRYKKAKAAPPTFTPAQPQYIVINQPQDPQNPQATQVIVQPGDQQINQ